MADPPSASYLDPPNPNPQPQFIQPHASDVSAPPDNGGLQMAYPNVTAGSHTLEPEQAVYSYPMPIVIQPLLEKPLPIVSSNPPQAANCLYSSSGINALKRKWKPIQSVRCEMCDIFCTSIELYKMHVSGKKHLKTLKKKYASETTPSQPASPTIVNNSTSEKLSTSCNVQFNSDKALEDHLAGKRDGAQEIANTIVGLDGASSSASGAASAEHVAGEKQNLQESIPLPYIDGETATIVGGHDTNGIPSVCPGQDLGTKKQKLIQCGVAEGSMHVCTTCNVVCNSEVAFADHIAGKKHTAQVQKSSGAIDLNQVAPPTSRKPPENLDLKRRKMERSGAHPTAVRICDVCNIICNSDSVFNSHLAGQKHASMLKKMAQAPAALSNPQ